MTVTVDATTSPSLSDLDGTVFAVTAPRKSGEEETPVSQEPVKTPEGGTTSTGSTGSSGVSGFTTKSLPKISLAAPVKVTAGSVRVSLQCGSGSGHCPAVTLQLTVTEHLHDHRVGAITAGATTRKVLIGQLKVTLAAGQSKVVTLSLNSAGKRLLKTHRKFKADLTVRAEGTTVKTQTVTFARRAKR